jgi:hypothetical protein
MDIKGSEYDELGRVMTFFYHRLLKGRINVYKSTWTEALGKHLASDTISRIQHSQ